MYLNSFLFQKFHYFLTDAIITYSYNSEVAATKIKTIKLQNALNTYSKFNTVKINLEDEEDRYTLCNAFTAWVSNSSSLVPERDFMYNETRKNFLIETHTLQIWTNASISILDKVRAIRVNSKG